MPAPRHEGLRRAALVVAVVVGVVASVVSRDGVVVGAIAAVVALALHATGATSRDGRLWFGLGAGAAVVVVIAVVTGRGDVAFVASLVALALRVGVVPLHAGVFAVAERQPALLMELFGSAIAAVLLHLRLLDDAHTLAHDVAVPVVALGAGATVVGALFALAKSTLRGLWAASAGMHAGMLLAAVGAAGRGHTVAAVLVVVTLALAMAGFGFVVAALEARVGHVTLTGPGGRVRAFPTLAAAFAFFAAAGVGLPGTAGFIADDLLLHALWEEGPVAAAVVVVASAMLAVSLLRGYGAVFLGPAGPRPVAHDLDRRERVVVAVLVVMLVVIGILPMLMVEPASRWPV
jgi:NADH-quinone oxidoreductase subunit M